MKFDDDGATLDDGYAEIFLAPSANDQSEFADLMRLFTETDYFSKRFPVMSKVKGYYLTNEIGSKEMGSLFKEYLDEWKDEWIEEGRKEGREKGQVQLIELMQRLLAENRYDDFKRLMREPDYRKRLLREFFPND